MIDGVLVANELVDYASKEGKECLLFKVDFEKAYDKVNWNFLRFMMRKLGFRDIWMKWMEALIFTSTMSVLVNGSPTKKFEVGRGLSQGDPISPFLFVIVPEGLKLLVNKTVSNGDSGCNVNGRCFVDVLQFADDTLMVGDGTCRKDSKEFLFLEILVGYNPRRVHTWGPMVDMIRNRLSTWKSRWLSFRGRITLIKSVLSSLVIFTLSFYKAPLKGRYRDVNLCATNGRGNLKFLKTKLIWWSDLSSLESKLPEEDVSIASMGGWRNGQWF
ncbi:uncharacterized protein LOC131620174 [Vicia villosa]|uniref:uncharacterized protein LOC131620174 n=1 Tax=Vicia villosa TaxID=3911 RepID=UPI00273AC348|nr:uncharacterized protein LOC131620174 [Vicia villosa]